MRQSQGDLRAQPIRQPGAQIQGHNHYLQFSSIFYFVITYFVEDLESLQVKNSFNLPALQIKNFLYASYITHLNICWKAVRQRVLQSKLL